MKLSEQHISNPDAMEPAEPLPIAAVMSEVLAHYGLLETRRVAARTTLSRREQPFAELAVA